MLQKSEVLSLLTDIELTRSLSEDTRKTLSEQCSIKDLPPRQRIRLSDSQGNRLFLVDGHAVRLIQGLGERVQSYKGLSEPVDIFGDSNGSDDCLITETPCILLRIPTGALHSALKSNIEVNVIELDAAEGEFLAELYQLITSNRLDLPARPEVALKIQELTSDPNAGVGELTEVIQRDGTIAGALLHATNSPLFRAAREILSVRDAVLRLGFRNTRILTTSLALRQAFKAKHRVTREAMKRVWSDSVLCSAFSYLLAHALGILHQERALLSGLVAGIGAVPIIQFIEVRDPQPQIARIDSLVNKLINITGVLVINYWGLGEDLVTVAEQYGNWGYQASTPNYATITTVARWAALSSEGRPVPDATEVPAFKVLDLSPPGPGEEIAKIAHLGEELRALKSMFNV